MNSTVLSFLPSDARLVRLLTLVDQDGGHVFAQADPQENCSWSLEMDLQPRNLAPGTVRGLGRDVRVQGVEIRFKATNRTDQPRTVVSWEALRMEFQGQETGPGGHQLWAYCGASHPERPDWIRPVVPGFSESGWLGMNDTDYGGGNPLAAVWNSRQSLALGCLSAVPEVLGFPLTRPGSGPAVVSVSWSADGSGAIPGEPVPPGQSLVLPPLWLAACDQDGLALLVAWRQAMEEAGRPAPHPSEGAREPTWCAWGYERDFTLTQVTNALPKVAELGFSWFTLDDGWQSEEGDITLNPAKFPGGETQMRDFVAEVHRRGMKAMLWWLPLAADPKSQWWAVHPNTLVRDGAGKPSDISWWDSALLCPSHPEVIAETRRQLEKFYQDWGFDGLKIDGQHLNAVPPCHDPSHGHTHPLEPHRRFPEFWRMVKQVSDECRPGATVMFCPCGTTYNLHAMPYYDMPVASDPSGSWQVRTKGAVFKALMAPDCAFHGDHVELSDRERDFASTVGIGGIVDTKFTWPPGSSNPSVFKPGGNFDLLPEGEQRLKSWLEAMKRERLDQAVYTLGDYRFGFDPVEMHVLDAGSRRYYSCYAWTKPGEDSLGARWSGRLEIRGLTQGTWKATVWSEAGEVCHRDLGVLTPGSSFLEASFTGNLLIRLDRLS